ncbi:MAG: hypothetical protein ACWGOX_06280 [Desulforhopalus sp.]
MLQHPLFYQFKVRPAESNADKNSLAGAIATVMVFAESECVGRCRSSRFIERSHWEIEELMRVMAVRPPLLQRFDKAFKGVYRQAELFGIAACYDSWKKHPHK